MRRDGNDFPCFFLILYYIAEGSFLHKEHYSDIFHNEYLKDFSNFSWNSVDNMI
jgi:hypothetical protein